MEAWNHVFKWRDLDPQISANLFGSLIDGVSTSFLHIIKIPFPQKKHCSQRKNMTTLFPAKINPPKLTPPQKKTQTPPILPTIFPIKTTPPQECTYLTPSRRAQWPWLPRHLGVSQLGPCSQRLRSSATPRERRTEEARSSWSSRLLWFTMGHFGLLWFSMVVLFFLKSILCNIYIYMYNDCF